MKLDKTVFREYDIRGYAQDAPEHNATANLTADLAFCIGKSLGSRLKIGATVVVSGDHRTSTSALRKAVVDGYTSTGVNVLLDENPVPSGGNNWYLIRHNLDGAVQITGSHNPWYFNGMKISEGLKALYGAGLKALIPVIETNSYRTTSVRGKIEKINRIICNIAQKSEKLQVCVVNLRWNARKPGRKIQHGMLCILGLVDKGFD